jgi:transposase-like protein
MVHLLRNSFRYTGRQHFDRDRQGVAADLHRPDRGRGDGTVPSVLRDLGRALPDDRELWENAWAEFVPFLSFDVEIRKIVCTTDEIVNPLSGCAGSLFWCPVSPPFAPAA